MLNYSSYRLTEAKKINEAAPNIAMVRNIYSCGGLYYHSDDKTLALRMNYNDSNPY